MNSVLPRWKLVVAFTIVYITWGTTYLAIRAGVQTLPPALFGGVRIFTAGTLLLLYLLARREPLRMPWREVCTNALVGLILFVGGNGLVTFGEMTVPSGIASLLVATTPMWMALLEMLLPRGARLRPIGWLGLGLGLAGVLVLLAPKLEATDPLSDFGPFLVLGSSACWSVGSVLARYQSRTASHLVAAAYQMMIGGGCMTLYGLQRGEVAALSADCFSPVAIYSFFHLLAFGSLLGFLTYNWLLGHVSAASAGTYAYVNPMIAVLVGWIIAREDLTVWVLVGMVIILTGVGLVRLGARRRESHVYAPRPSHPVRFTDAEDQANLCAASRPRET